MIKGGIEKLKVAINFVSIFYFYSQQKGNCNGNFCLYAKHLNANRWQPERM